MICSALTRWRIAAQKESGRCDDAIYIPQPMRPLMKMWAPDGQGSGGTAHGNAMTGDARFADEYRLQAPRF